MQPETHEGMAGARCFAVNRRRQMPFDPRFRGGDYENVSPAANQTTGMFPPEALRTRDLEGRAHRHLG